MGSINELMQFPRPPLAHQEREWLADRDREWHAITWEQGTMKTYLLLMVAQWLYLAGKIDAVLVVTPSGVHQNWVDDEIPLGMPLGMCQPLAYLTHRATTKWHQKELANHSRTSFPVLAMSYDAVNTHKGFEMAAEFVNSRRCLMVLDEAHYIANLKAKRTAKIMMLGKFCPYRRILTGTPMPDNPLNEYSLFEWLCPGFWAERGYPDKTTFDNCFAIMKEFREEGARWSHKRAVAYRNVDRLHEILAPHCARVLKKDVLDLPPKIYLRRYYQMTPDQQRAYDAIREDMFAELGGGRIVSADRGAGVLGKLQQILCGFAIDATGEEIELPGKNPRLKLLRQLVDDARGPAILWAYHRHSVRQIVEALKADGKKVCHYYGETAPDDRQRAKHGFMDGTYDYFVGNPGSGAGTGHTLHRAEYQVYYSNSMKWVHRVQSEDRVHRGGLQHEAVIYDLIGRTLDGKPTMDERKILHKLHTTAKLAAKLTGDDLSDLIA